MPYKYRHGMIPNTDKQITQNIKANNITKTKTEINTTYARQIKEQRISIQLMTRNFNLNMYTEQKNYK